MRLPLSWLAVLALAGYANAEPVRFNRDVRPILSDNCYACHGPDEAARKARLRLDVRADAMDVLAPGKIDDSELIARIFDADADFIMPPPESHKKLTAKQKAILQQWVAEGAEYQGHWAYEQPVKPAIPAGVNPVDHLVGQRLAAIGLKPSPAADPRTLARRLNFDLVGLPPTPEDVDALAADPTPEAWAKYVDSLLASPHYGERMAIGWLDAVRFADTIGYHSDNPHNVWPYRDYVIKSFNDNKPFDRFTVEQLAGDLLPDATAETRVASAFNRLLLTTAEGGAQAKDYEARMLADRVRAVGTVWLGQTLGCCQCHDHKYDPVLQREFYAMGAFFADIQEPIIGRREPGMAVPSPEQEQRLVALRSAADGAKNAAALVGPAAGEAAANTLADFDASLPRVLVSVTMAKPRTVRVLPRGNWMDESGEVVQPAVPGYLANGLTPPSGERLTRLDLARWVVDAKNPLTARVFVNRLWAQFFGVGLCKSLEDLGSQGEWPPHLELLDALAIEFVESGWDIKHLVRLIVTSRVYQQSSVASPEMLTRDPDNRLLARQSRYRLPAELVRDNALSIAGSLNPQIGGPSVRPYQPEGYWENLNFPRRSYTADRGADQYRRGLYTWWQRSFPHPSMLAFDAPTREECSAGRTESNIPQQAMVLLNDPTYVEAARTFAARIIADGGADTDARITWAFRRAVQRESRPEERKVIAALVAKQRTEYTANRPAAEALVTVGQSPAPKNADVAELAAWTNAARVILNMHETITRN